MNNSLIHFLKPKKNQFFMKSTFFATCIFLSTVFLGCAVLAPSCKEAPEIVEVENPEVPTFDTLPVTDSTVVVDSTLP